MRSSSPWMRGTIASAMLVALTSLASHAADWPTYRGDLQHTSASSETLPRSLGALWQYNAPEAPRMGWAGEDGKIYEGKVIMQRVKFDDALQVTVAGGRVYFGSSVDHHVHCLNSDDGRTVWTFCTEGPVRLAPTIAGGRAYFGSDDGMVYCVDAATGKLVWKLRGGPADERMLARGEMISRWPIRTSVLVDGGMAYFGAGIFPHEEVYLHAVNASDGTTTWRRDNISHTDAGRDDLSPQGYLLATKDLLFVPSGRSLPAAIDRSTGKTLHKRVHHIRSTVLGGTEALLADNQLYTFGADDIAAMDEKTGDLGFAYFSGRQMAAAGKTAYLINGQKLRKIDRLEHAVSTRTRFGYELTILTLTRKLGKNEGVATEIKEQIEASKRSLAKHTETGVEWTVPCTGSAALVATADAVFVGGDDKVTAYSTESGEEVWSAKVDGEARGLAVANGKLFVSTTQGRIYAFAGGTNDAVAIVSKLVDNPYPRDEEKSLYATAAQQIVERTGVNQGFCLVVGGEEGRLAYELAKRCGLHIYCIEPDKKKVDAARKYLTAAGFYGHRVVVHQAPLDEIPYANYFANLIVSDSLLLTGKLPEVDPSRVVRHLKPIGGQICFGRPENSPGESPTADATSGWLAKTGLKGQSKTAADGLWTRLTRGALPGSGSWTHQYGDPGNTASSSDRRIKGGLGVLWFGDPGPSMMVNRHDGAVGPLAVGGRLIVQGSDKVVAYDAYNGLFLWEFSNPTAIRTGVYNNETPGNLAASDDSIFMFAGDSCVEIDLTTGALKRTHKLPLGVDGQDNKWGYVAYYDGMIYGTATVRQEVEAKKRRRGKATIDSTDTVFAINAKTGQHAWQYRGKSISHHTIAIGKDGLFLVDSSLTSEERAQLLQEDKTKLKNLPPEEAKKEEERLKKLDVRTVVALDAKTGRKFWAEPVDVTDCSEIGIGGGKLTMIYNKGVLVLGGANANGHYWQQFVNGDFSRRRLVAVSATSGSVLWHKDANYRHRPIVIGEKLIAEPWAFDLLSGEQQMRPNAVTSEPEPWSIMRAGHHCGMITGCENMLFFRSGATGFYDMKADVGIQHFAGHRLGCWINAIPAGGLVMIPEAGAGCTCLFSIESTIVMEPREPRRPWAISSFVGNLTPVKHLALNLGAPGDRRDERGTLWLAYPRPKPYKETSLEVNFDLKPKFVTGGGYDTANETTAGLTGVETPWVFTSWARGLTQLTVPLRGENDGPALYKVKLYFTDLANDAAGQRVFDVRLQGKTVADNLDIAGESRGRAKPLVREFSDIAVDDDLVIELSPETKSSQPLAVPILSAIEVTISNAD